MDQLDFFVGVDWSSTDHQVCVVDMKGKVCAQRSFKHCGMGLTEMVDWIVRTTQSSPHKVGVAIETPPVVESLSHQSQTVGPLPSFQPGRCQGDRLDACVGRNRAISPATSRCADARSGDATRLLAWTVP